jgi:uncharacterized protein YjcR
MPASNAAQTSTDSGTPEKVVSAKRIADALEVTPKTIKRWAKEYGWKVIRINSRLIRYHKSEVERSLGVNL